MVEGTICFRGFRTWYRVVGDPSVPRSPKLPVLALHGGPGLPHDSLEPLVDLARTGRPVVFYDQLGCGNSTRARDPNPWSVELFLEELAVVRRELGLDAVHLLGHSWGGLLAGEHALGGADGLASLVLVGAVASGRTLLERRRDFYGRLPRSAREDIRKHEAAGTFGDPEYGEAMNLFHRRYSCRLDPWPGWLDRALSKMDVEANAAMWGPPNVPVRRHGRGPGAGSPRWHTELGVRSLRRELPLPVRRRTRALPHHARRFLHPRRGSDDRRRGRRGEIAPPLSSKTRPPGR